MIDRATEEKVAAAVAAALLPRNGVKIVGAYEAAEAGEVKGEETAADGIVVGIAVGAPAWDAYLVPSCSMPVALSVAVRREVAPTGDALEKVMAPISNLLMQLQHDATAVDRLLTSEEFQADGVRVDGGPPPSYSSAKHAWTVARTFTVRGVPQFNN